MKFQVDGPFDLPRDRKFITTSAKDKRTFWRDVDDRVPGLSEACACYVFTIRNRAWYVGLTIRRFQQEVFQPHKVILYNSALQEINGKPQLLLLAKITPQGRFAKPGNENRHRDITILENLLIGVGIKRNADLRNIRGTKLLREMYVPGLLNDTRGNPRQSVQVFKKAMGL
jgi:hypothetical protein